MILFSRIILVKFEKCINEIPIMNNVLVATSQWKCSADHEQLKWYFISSVINANHNSEIQRLYDLARLFKKFLKIGISIYANAYLSKSQ